MQWPLCRVGSAGKGQALAQLLIIDDDHATLANVRQILIDAGWSARATSDPHTALQIFKEDAEIAITITGIQMSAMDGFTLIRRLRLIAPGQRSFRPLIVAKSVDLNIATNAIEHQVSAIVATPVSPSFLKQKVSEAWSSMDAAEGPLNTASSAVPESNSGRRGDYDDNDALQHPWGSIASAVARRTCDLLLERVGSMFSEAATDEHDPAPPSTLQQQMQNAADKADPPIDLLLSLMKLKRKFFPEPLFGDPCWDMLVDLGMSHMEERSISVSSLCIAAGIPQTTALRRIADLENIGLVIRAKDPDDGRRIYVALTELGLKRFFGFLKEFSDQMDRSFQPSAIWPVLQKRQQMADYCETPH